MPPVTPEPVVEPEPPVDPLVVALSKAFDAAAEQPGLEGAAIGFCLIGPDGEVVYAARRRRRRSRPRR